MLSIVKTGSAGVSGRKKWALQAGQSFFCGALVAGGAFLAPTAFSQAPAAAAPAAATSQTGTVKAIAGNSLTLTPDKGADVTITVPDGARILQIAPGSKTLTGAQTIALSVVAVGDRVLVSVKTSDAGALTASRVVLMKSTDIAEQHAAEAADWQKRGSGGIVAAVNGTALTVTAGAKKIQVQTTTTTIFRRYAGDSVKFEDAVKGSLAQIHAGDQMRVRGAKADDGTVSAEEIVSGSFKNLSGTLTAVDATAGSVTLKDLATKKTLTVHVTANSAVKALPEMAARMLARAGSPDAGQSPAGGAPGSGSAPAGAPAARQYPGGGAGGPGGGGMGGGGMGGGRAPDLSQIVARLPLEPVSALKSGDVVMIVVSAGSSPDDPLTAVTLLSGVEPLLTSKSSASAAMTLSPWNVGAPEMGGQ